MSVCTMPPIRAVSVKLLRYIGTGSVILRVLIMACHTMLKTWPEGQNPNPVSKIDNHYEIVEFVQLWP